MFVRFRQTKRKLQVSLCENRWIEGRPRQEHIAQLGSIEMPPSVEGRIAFWSRLHERLARLGNRVDANAQGKILGDVHARIPMVTLDEQRQLKIEHAETNEHFWTGHRDYLQGNVAGHEELAAEAERVIVTGRAQATESAAKAASAKDAADRLRRGEDASVEKPLTREQVERVFLDAGMTKDDLRRCTEFNEICNVLDFDEVMKTLHAQRERDERRAIRALHRRVRRSLARSRE
jgi:hypothetical protein